ncbi:4-hydroxyphenylacetate 3-hydroxylase N-terminal domain-containing protein [Streptomyces spinosisporus]|uniref:4-hydroxyphenylacetate 3-hydroxylase n=1 Tax=Streptomyces spinosisporus TaxID=2927582 RepID=A0ABS9XDB8_9ACTN|nr:4-hydroxyphenylacetate 3-hydroxylase N-terminal domain-containing protein [Streptomyces spinosisporus]MCI3240075.1 4-hydroxyphenylacetate 3-hydroxylase [Streptomyces spinosisporus]
MTTAEPQASDSDRTTDGTALLPGSPGGAWRGSDYIASIKDEREVWCDGRRVDVTGDPKFRPMLTTLAGLYDAQHLPDRADEMLHRSDTSGNLVSLSYLAPADRDELSRKWANSHRWAEASYGQLSRVPDFMSNVVVGLYDFRHELAKVDPEFGRNAENYYHYCRENDLTLTHGLGDPQIDRSSTPAERPELGLRVVRRGADGIVVRGAKQIATLAPYAHEVLIYLSPANYLREDPSYVCWFAVPLATPGLRVLCRTSYTDPGVFGGLAAHYDEQDAMLVFDDVFIPMDRVFLLDDSATAVRGFGELNKWSLYTGQLRYYHRLRTMLGVASLLAQAIGVETFRQVGDLLGELTSYVEIVRLGLAAVDAECRPTTSGLLAPGSTAALDAVADGFSTRASAIIRQIGASGLIMQPSEADLRTPDLRTVLDTYMCGRELGVKDKSRLFRLAADLVVDRFGMRQELYETWNRGDPARVRSMLYARYPDLQRCETQARKLAEGRIDHT